MKKSVASIIIILLFICGINTAQNLIANGDFELGPDSTSIGWCCRTNEICDLSGSMAGPDSWTVVTQSPDRLIEGDIPCAWDQDTAQSGKAYIDFVYGERGKTELTAPLEVNSVYKLSYYVSWQRFSGAAIHSSRIQFEFNNGGNIIYSPEVNHDHWQYYDTTFVASTNSTELEIRGAKATIGGVNIDNMVLEKLNTDDIFYIQHFSKNISVYPNPVVSQLNVQTQFNETLEFILYDHFSREISRREFKNSLRFDMESLPEGVYFSKIIYRGSTVRKGIVVKEQ